MRPGERVATDGVVVRGTSAIDASLLTGEAVPVEVEPGDEVTGATVNAGGRLVVRATRVGADTRLAQMARLVDAAQNGKADVQRLADRVSAVFVPVVIAIAAGTLGFWLGAGAGRDGRVHRRRGRADRGLPVRPRAGHADRADGRHRPRRPARHPDPRPRGARGHPPHRHRRARQDRHRHDRADGAGRRRRRARRASRRRTPAGRRASRPPRSTRSAARSRRPYAAATGTRGRGVRGLAGPGVAARVEGRRVEVGRPGAGLPRRGSRRRSRRRVGGPDRRRGRWTAEPAGVLVVADTVKPTSAEAVRRLRDLGLRPVLLTGDNERTARAVAAEVGIDGRGRRGARPRARWPRCAGCRSRAAWSPWSATA